MRRASKLLITMLTLVVLFAVFAFGASATDHSTDITEGGTYTWGDGDTISTTGDYFKIDGGTKDNPVIINISGTVTLNTQIRIGSGANYSNVKFVGSDNAVLLGNAPSTESMIYIVNGGILDVTGVTIDANIWDEDKLSASDLTVDYRCICLNSASGEVHLRSGAVLTGGFRASRNTGSAAALYGKMYLYEGSSVSKNGHGSAILVGSNGKLYLEGGSITDNSNIAVGTGEISGGAVRINNSSAYFEINSGTISDNFQQSESANYGGAIYMSAGELVINGGTFSGNSNERLNNTGTTWGGGFLCMSGSAKVTINGGTFSNNSSTHNGGAIDIHAGTIEIYGGTFSGNKSNSKDNAEITGASSSGGAIYCAGSASAYLTLSTDIIFSENYNSKTAEDYVVGNNANVTVVDMWKSVDDVWVATSYSETYPELFKASIGINLRVIELCNDITLGSSRMRLNTTTAITMRSHGDETYTLYGGSTSSYMCELLSNQKFTLENIIWDAQAVTKNEETSELTYVTARRAFYINSATLTLGDGAIIRHAASTNAGGAISIGETTGVLNLNEGSVIEECMQKGNAGIIYVHGTLNIAGGKISNNVSIKNGDTSSNGTISTSSSGIINMTAGEISGNKVPGQGGAIYLQGTATISDGTISGNYAGSEGSWQMGGAIQNRGSLTIEGGTISGNYAGGGIITQVPDTASMTISGGTITNNTTYNGSAAVYIYGGDLTMTAGIISNNAATGGYGGGIRIGNTAGVVSITGGTISGNTAAYGGGIYIDGTAVELGAVTISGNTSSKHGGGLYITGTLNDTETTDTDESDPSSVTINGTIITDNQTGNGWYGGGMQITNNSTVTIESVTLTGNVAQVGAAIRIQTVYPTVTINDGTIKDNTAKSTSLELGFGGAISNMATLVINGGTISGNTAAFGAGIVNVGTITIDGNTTITDNLANGDDLAFPKDSQSNIGVDMGGTTDNVVFKATWTGAAGIAPYQTPDLTDGISFDVATVEEGAQGTLSADAFYNVAIADKIATVTAKEIGKLVMVYNGSTAESVREYTVHTGEYPIPTAFTSPDGYDSGDFLGFVKVSGYGTELAAAEEIVASGTAVTAADLANIYAVWVKVNTLTSASASISANSGIRFFTTVDSKVLESVGIKVKTGTAEGDGYYRGTLLGTSTTDLTADLSKDNKKMDVKVNNTGWANAAAYGVTVDEGCSAFAATITYNSDAYYNFAVAYRGYIEITVGDTVVTIYSDFTNPGELTDSSDNTYGDVHANSACAIVRSIYFSGAYSEESLKEKIKNEVGEENTDTVYANMLAIAGYESFPV